MKKTIIIEITAIISLGLYILYFVSRGQAYGRLFTINLFWVIVLAYTTDVLLYRLEKVKLVGYVPLMVLSSMCVAIFIQSGHTLYQRAEAGVYNKKDFVEFADMVADSLPTNTFMIGIGIPELCSVNDRLEMQKYYLDIPDIQFLDKAYDVLLNDIGEASYVLTEKDTIKRNDEIGNILSKDFMIIHDWTYNNVITYELYEKVK